jgi:hypothetical protein
MKPAVAATLAAKEIADRNLGKPAVVVADINDGRPIAICWIGEHPSDPNPSLSPHARGRKVIEHQPSKLWPPDAPEGGGSADK